MPLIYCQTVQTAPFKFELIQSEYIGLNTVSENIIAHESANGTRAGDARLLAAIINVGLACRELSDRAGEMARVVGIESDKDGLDVKHGGEHDILFSLLVPSNDFEARKQISLYFEFERYLARIKTLMLRADIKIVLQTDGEIRYNNVN